VSQLQITGVGAAFGIGRNFNYTNQLRLDYHFFRGDADERVGPGDFLIDDDVRVGELVMQYQHDSLDSVYFPTKGATATLAYSHASKALGADSDYEQAIFEATKAWSFGRNILLAHSEAAYSFDDLAPLERSFQLGGFTRLSGLIPDQLTGRHLGLLSVSYMRKLVDIDLAPVYAGITVEARNVWDFSDDISFGDLQNAGSAFIGAETPIGPVYLAWGYHESGESTWYFYVGSPFGFRKF
jgi:NTE family protein